MPNELAPTVGGIDPLLPLDRLTDDLSRRIWGPDDIAQRYGLSLEQLYQLVANPEIRALIKRKRAIWESDENIVGRLQAYNGIAALEATPGILAIMNDPSVPASTRIDLYKTATKLSGAEAAVSRQAVAAAGPAPPTFAVNIHFSGGRVETIAPVIEVAPIPDDEAA